jgi:hypothetical protein
MDAVGALIHRDRGWSVGTGIGNMLRHLFHDERIADEEPQYSRLVEPDSSRSTAPWSSSSNSIRPELPMFLAISLSRSEKLAADFDVFESSPTFRRNLLVRQFYWHTDTLTSIENNLWRDWYITSGCADIQTQSKEAQSIGGGCREFRYAYRIGNSARS